ncbi:hypothetical protein E2C01_061321 [Portunus trituberculatus]|uniref:Uncharacterized protein n=1 Tax=Portunus trituberculatus TaxID=210409 RepID=A0A5B7HC49_PORTR|nr:hypothetical protein [Portunus trituberculatus]
MNQDAAAAPPLHASLPSVPPPFLWTRTRARGTGTRAGDDWHIRHAAPGDPRSLPSPWSGVLGILLDVSGRPYRGGRVPFARLVPLVVVVVVMVVVGFHAMNSREQSDYGENMLDHYSLSSSSVRAVAGDTVCPTCITLAATPRDN